MLAPIDTAKPLAASGHALIEPQRLIHDLELDETSLDELRPSWERLPRDTYLRDGGRYRYRRHACFRQKLARPNALERVPHRAHWQSTNYNALHGGIERWFEPIEVEVTSMAIWSRLLCGLGQVFATLARVPQWYIEAHQFRIDTAEGIGRPTPEGAHRDGVDFVAVILVQRRDVRGGETRVFEASSSGGVRFTMHVPWTALLLDDARVIHETTPIQPAEAPGVRDTLVLTYRANGFQSPPA
ncbi:MAG: 2OG-Fe dioxygenase family protein [Steroidobacteraceae bacterium]